MAVLLPNGRQQFCDANGRPLAGGLVYMYQPGTTTPATTWQDAGQTVPNQNPIMLDAAGEAVIYGIGNYRQIVQDVFGNLVWDQLTGIGMSGIPGGFIYASTFGLRQGRVSDAAAIQAAVNAAAALAGGATVYLGPGPITFTAGQQVIWPSTANGVSLKGDGPFSTVINISGSLSTDVLVLTAGSLANCQIRDLAFSCTGIATNGALIHFGNCIAAQVENVRMAGGFWNGVLITGGAQQTETRIRDLIAAAFTTANACVLIGDDQNGTVNTTYISNCSFSNSQFGVYVRNGNGVSVTSCDGTNHVNSAFVTSPAVGDVAEAIVVDNFYVNGCGQTGITIGTSGGNLFGISINSCWVGSCLTGIVVAATPNSNLIQISGCQLFTNKQQAFNNFGANGVIFMGNICGGNGTAALNTYDVVLQQNGLNCVIANNSIFSTTVPLQHRYGINFTGGSDYSIVHGNTTGSSGTASISNTATGTHNVVVNNTGT